MGKRHDDPPQDDALDRIARTLRLAREAARQGNGAEAGRTFHETLTIAEAAIEARDEQHERFWKFPAHRDEPEGGTVNRRRTHARLTKHDATWAWADMRAVNAPMLDWLQELDRTDPLPEEPGVAAPMTAAGFFVLRAAPGTRPRPSLRRLPRYCSQGA